MKSSKDFPPTPYDDLFNAHEASYQRGTGFIVLVRIAAILAAVLLIIYCVSAVMGKAVA